jgi:dipeptidase E
MDRVYRTVAPMGQADETVRLYLSSFGLGNRPDELLALLRGGRRAGLVLNAKDGNSAESRARSLVQETEALAGLGLDV